MLFSIPSTKCMGCWQFRDRVAGTVLCHVCHTKVLSTPMPPPEPIDRQPKPSTPTEPPKVTRTKENLDRVLSAIELAAQAAIENGTYKLPSRNAMGVSLGLDDYFYGGTLGGKQAAAAYNEAQTRLTLLKAERESAVRSQESAVDPQPTTNDQIPP